MFGGRFMAALLLRGVVLALLPARYAVGAEKHEIYNICISVFFVWAVLPIALALLTSLVLTPHLRPRYLIGSLPPLLLAGTYGLSRFARGWAGFGVAVILSVAVLTSYFNYNWRHREDWRGVSAMLKERLRPSDCVLFTNII